jgi:hypothetical protein
MQLNDKNSLDKILMRNQQNMSIQHSERPRENDNVLRENPYD